MLPGLRFVLAATVLAVSLLVFGMGAIALLRASHQQVANLSAQAVPEPVFAQAPQTVPSLSVLRVEPQAEQTAAIAADAGRVAALTAAVREPEPAAVPVIVPEAPPMAAEPHGAAPAPDSRSDAAQPPEPAPLEPEATPVSAGAQIPPPDPPPPVSATADITGSTPSPASAQNAPPAIVRPPMPQVRPEAAGPVAALAPGVAEAAKPAAAKKMRAAKHRHVRRVRTQIAPAASSNPFGALFGSTSN